MADRVKGITIEFRGDTTDLSKAINKVRKEAKDFDKELGYINNSLKFNPKNVDLLRQKIAVLSDASEASKKNIDEMKKALEKLKADGVSEASAEYRELEREIIRAENKQKDYNAQLQKVKAAASPLGQAAAKMESFGNAATKAGEALKGVSTFAAGIDVALAGLAYKSGQAADDLNTLSKVTGISTDELQKYKAASDLVDVSVESIAKSQKKLKATMYSAQQGTKGAVDAFAALDVNVQDANGHLRNQDEVFSEVLAALGQMENETERDAIAMQIFGKSAADLNPLIEDSGETYKRVADLFAENGLAIVDEDTLNKANQFNDYLDEIKATWGAALSTVGMQLAGYLAPALEKVAAFLEKVAGWVSSLSPQTLTIIGIIAGIVAGLAPLLLLVGKVAFAISSIMTLMSTLGPIIAGIAGPIGIAIAAIAAIIAIGVALYKNWDTIKEKAGQIKDWVVAKWSAMKDAIANIAESIKYALTHPFETAMAAIKAIIDKIKGFFDNFNINLPHISLPHFSISPPGWKLSDLLTGSIPRLGIDWYDKGGIFNSPSIIGVGEKRPEFVGALDDLRDIVRQEAGGNITINVNAAPGMDVTELAREVERRLVESVKRQKYAWG